MPKIFPIHPANPHRICWGCNKYCSVDAMACANERSPHPAELFGDDWLAWGDEQLAPQDTNDNGVRTATCEPDVTPTLTSVLAPDVKPPE